MAPRGKHAKTLSLVFQEPARTDLRWVDVEGLIVSIGGEIAQGRGSRVRVFLNGVHAVFHRPHPSPCLGRGAVRSLRRFFVEAGAVPEV